MQPSQRELYFSKIPILVEGIEDVAFISTHLELTEKWGRFRELGCHFVICDGKSRMSRPLAIANGLEIRAFVVFDSDADCPENEQKSNRRDNACLLRLCGLTEFDPLPAKDLWGQNVVMWKSRIGKVVKGEIGAAEWEVAVGEARMEMGFDKEVGAKCTLLICAILEKLSSKGIRSAVLSRLCEQILKFAESASH